jgi:hypothetical protein
MSDEQKGTEYVVLKADVADPARGIEGLHRWEVLEEGDPGSGPVIVRAANDVAAIKAAAKLTGADLSNGAVAVPARSWRPRKREVKSVQRELWT